MEFEIKENCRLLEFLYSAMADKSRTTVKSYLTHRQVSVNGCITTRFDMQLVKGDKVAVSTVRAREGLRNPMLRIVFEDDSLIVIDKRSGLLSMATDKEQVRTAYHILSDYVKSDDSESKIFIVHRLDRETSGLMMFAKNQNVQELMQRNWKELVNDRRYVALIEGALPEQQGQIESYLTEDRNHKVWVTREGEGKKAVTYYSVLKRSEQYELVDLKLETGRKNQIRAHMEWAGCPIAGDKKYGAKTNPASRVCLHAYKLCFRHPLSGEQLNFVTRIPDGFEV